MFVYVTMLYNSNYSLTTYSHEPLHKILDTLFFLTLAARRSAGTRFITGPSCTELRVLPWV